VLTVVKKDTRKMNVPNSPGTTEPPPRPEGKAKLLKENIGWLRREVAPGRKTLLGWPLLRIMRRTRTVWAPFSWAPRSLWSK
jgi:hypothetical protein